VGRRVAADPGPGPPHLAEGVGGQVVSAGRVAGQQVRQPGQLDVMTVEESEEAGAVVSHRHRLPVLRDPPGPPR
jgi:hypothetical protein